jgi:hypothetical protein
LMRKATRCWCSGRRSRRDEPPRFLISVRACNASP